TESDAVFRRLAVVRVAHLQIVAVGQRDREVEAHEVEAVPELEVITVEIVAPAAELEVRPLLRRDRDRAERVVLRRAEAVPFADRDVEREDAVADAEVDLLVRVVEVVRVEVARVADRPGEVLAAAVAEV